MRYWLRLIVAAFLLLLLSTPAFAQGQLIISDPAGLLDESAIERAADPLVDRGAQVAVYLVQSGGEQDFRDRLIEDGLLRNDGLARTNLIALYVALDERYSDIRYGDDWAFALGVNDNFDFIRTTELNPGLSAGDFTGAMTAALTAIEAAIVAPPEPGGGIDVDTAPIAIGGVSLAAAAAAGYAVTRRNRARKARQALERRLHDAREGVGVLIADLGQRFRNAEEKAQFDRVSYAAEDVGRLTALQREALAAFQDVQTRFDDIGEQLDRHAKPTDDQIKQAEAGYLALREPAEAVSERLKAIEQLRRDLDAQASAAREEIDRAKKS